MKPARASVWDYLTVVYRPDDAPIDPRASMLRTRWLYAPTHLLRDVREGRWGRMSWGTRTVLALSALGYAAAAAGLLAVIVLALRMPWRAPGGLIDTLLNTPSGRVLIIVPLGMVFLWPAAWRLWLALGGADRATAVHRRERTRFLHAADPPERADVLRGRRSKWARTLRSWPDPRLTKQRHWLDPTPSALHWVLLPALIFITLFLQQVFGLMSLGSFVLIAPMYGLIVLQRWLTHRGQQRLERRLGAALAIEACPDCEYPLTDLAETPDPDERDDWPGPRRCPECGSPWPLVPPPWPAATASLAR